MNAKTSLYDFFAMVIPGFLWLLLISHWCKWNGIFTGDGINGIIGGLLLFIACYTMGLVAHKVLDRLLWLIKCMLKKFKNKRCLQSLRSRCIFPYLHCLIYFRNNKYFVKKMWEKFGKDCKENGGTLPNKSTKGSLHEYYEAYYALMKAHTLNNIPVLEAQVAFLRNIAPITLFYIIAMCCCDCSFWHHLSINPCCLAIALLILLAGMVIAFFSIQNKIYYLVWEGYEYLS
jgi:hypothetical protein